MRHELEILPDAGAVAARGAELVVQIAGSAIAARGSFTLAVSGGTTPWAMFGRLRDAPMPWERTVLFQVDERIAPDGDEARNLVALRAALAGAPADVRSMPVTDPDPEDAAAAYAGSLPERFDLAHLGLGDDGHTASLVPGDPVLAVADRLVALTGPYRGHRRMTLTYPALARAARVLWLVTGADKADPLARLLAGDTSIPAGRVAAQRSTILADRAAAGP
ncbi:MAG: 6-phosphogluconolactonase [Gaiellales bacterium]